MSINQKDIQKIAHLARINVSEEESRILETKLGSIMTMIDKMQAVNTDNVEPMSHALEVTQPLREDVVTEKDIRSNALELAPEVEQSTFIVPQVIE
jgi:aspartyl-tRNA(Asn)/glutamyl-tRNA(Gln) amidotransferase subunit C